MPLPLLRCRPQSRRGHSTRTSLAGSADGQAIDFQRRLAHADRHVLAVLAAGAHTRVHFQIASDHRHFGQCIGAVADQRRTPDGIDKLAVFDLPRFRGRENELATRDVDLTATEVNRVETVLYRCQDFVGVVVAGKQIVLSSVASGSPRTTRVGRCRWCDAHQRGVEAILHVALENTVLY